MTESFDVLSDVLQSDPLTGWTAGELRLASEWGLRCSGAFVAFYCVREGQCRLEVDAEEAIRSLAAGDLVIVMPGREHRLSYGSNSPAVPLEEAIQADPNSARGTGVSSLDGPSPRLICGCVVLDKRRVSSLLASLPPLLFLKGESGKTAPWLEQTLQLIERESDPLRPGRRAVVDHLAQMIFIQSIRHWMATHSSGDGHWLTALMDPDIGPALQLMHTRLDYPWTVAALADRVCLSRSAFAARFKAVVSKPPLQYLLECRMQKACALLAEGRCEIKEIAARIGYTTRTAFSNAFKRWSGDSPGTYRFLARRLASHSNGSSPDGGRTPAEKARPADREPVACREELAESTAEPATARLSRGASLASTARC